MPSLTTVRLNKEKAFLCKKTVHTKSPSSSSSPSFLDISPALSDYLSFPLSFTHLSSKPFTQFLINPFRNCLLLSWQTKDITMKDCSGIDPRNAPLHPHQFAWRMNNKHLFKTIPLSSNHQEHNPPKTPHLPLNPLPHLHSSSQNDSHAWTPWQESKPCEPTASLIIMSHPLTHSQQPHPKPSETSC